MAAEVMTSDELAATPPEQRYYVCQQCQRTGVVDSDFKMITVFKIGFVICRNCLGRKEPMRAETCSFCEQESDSITIGSDGKTRACADCMGEAD